MDAKEAIRNVVEFCSTVSRGYVDDLTDRELFVRSVPTANHIAWQLGHLVGSEHQMLTMLGHKAPALPSGFAEAHTKETATSDDPAKFFKKAEYLGLADKLHAATLAAIDTTPASELDKPSPEPMRGYAPTMGDRKSVV